MLSLFGGCSAEDRGSVDTGRKASGPKTTSKAANPPKTATQTMTHTTSTVAQSTKRTTSIATQPSTQAKTTSANPDLGIGDTSITASDNKLTVHSYESPIPPPDDYTKPDPGKAFAAIDVEGCANPDTNESTGLNPYDFTLQMPDNTRLEPDIGAKEPALNDTTLTPGDCVRGWVTFQVPQGQKPKFVVFTGSSIIKWAVQNVGQQSITSSGSVSQEQPASVEASSVNAPLPDASGQMISYEPENAVDGKQDTAWRVDGDGNGQSITLDYAQPVTVSRVGVIPGYDKIDSSDGTDRFYQLRSVRRAEISFSDGSSIEANFERDRAMQFFDVPNAKTTFVRITILDTYSPGDNPNGTTDPPLDSTAISEIQVQGP